MARWATWVTPSEPYSSPRRPELLQRRPEDALLQLLVADETEDRREDQQQWEQ
jgi:hypothetical protein